MQAAIIIDSLRCIAWLTERGVSTATISLCGHSLGGAVSIVNAAMLRNVVGVAVGAPAVRSLRLQLHAHQSCSEVGLILSPHPGSPLAPHHCTAWQGPAHAKGGFLLRRSR